MSKYKNYKTITIEKEVFFPPQNPIQKNEELILEKVALKWLNSQSLFRNLRLKLLWLRVSDTPPKKSRKGQKRISVKSEWTGERRDIYLREAVSPNQLRKPISVMEHQSKNSTGG